MTEIRKTVNTKLTQNTDVPVEMIKQDTSPLAECTCNYFVNKKKWKLPVSFKLANIIPVFENCLRNLEENNRENYHHASAKSFLTNSLKILVWFPHGFYFHVLAIAWKIEESRLSRFLVQFIRTLQNALIVLFMIFW